MGHRCALRWQARRGRQHAVGRGGCWGECGGGCRGRCGPAAGRIAGQRGRCVAQRRVFAGPVARQVGAPGGAAAEHEGAVGGRGHALVMQTPAGRCIGAAQGLGQRRGGVAHEGRLQAAAQRQRLHAAPQRARKALRAEGVGVARDVDVMHQRRGVGVQIAQLGLGALLDGLGAAGDLDVHRHVVVVDQRQIGAARCAAGCRPGQAGHRRSRREVGPQVGLGGFAQGAQGLLDQVAPVLAQGPRRVTVAGLVQRQAQAPTLLHCVDHAVQRHRCAQQLVFDEVGEGRGARHEAIIGRRPSDHRRKLALSATQVPP